MSQPICSLCGEPMPPGEEMLKYHGYSGPCPKPPLKEKDPAEIGLSNTEELRACVTMIRTWIPEVFPANERGQVHFVRAVVESVADTIERALPALAKAEGQAKGEGRQP